MFSKCLVAVLLVVGIVSPAFAQQPQGVIKAMPNTKYLAADGKTYQQVCDGFKCWWVEVPTTQYPMQPAASAIPILQLHQVPAGSVIVQEVDRGSGKYVRYSNGVYQSWVWFPYQSQQMVYPYQNPIQPTYPQYPTPQVPYFPTPFNPYGGAGPGGVLPPGNTPGGVVPDPNIGKGPTTTTTTPKPDSGPPKPEATK